MRCMTLAAALQCGLTRRAFTAVLQTPSVNPKKGMQALSGRTDNELRTLFNSDPRNKRVTLGSASRTRKGIHTVLDHTCNRSSILVKVPTASWIIWVFIGDMAILPAPATVAHL